jgi:hypothetical protein
MWTLIAIDWRHLALYALAVYFPFAPFAYKFARDEGNRHAAAVARIALLYVVFFLWIAGGSISLYGLGMVFDRPAESCGIGCIEPGSAHRETPKGEFLVLGLVLILAAWWLGRVFEKLQGWLSARAASGPRRSKQTQSFDPEAITRVQQTIREGVELQRSGQSPIPPYILLKNRKKRAHREEANPNSNDD